VYFNGPKATVRKNLLLNSPGQGVNAWANKGDLIVTHNIIGGNAGAGVCSGGPRAIIAHNIFLHNGRCGAWFFRGGSRGSLAVNLIDPDFEDLRLDMEPEIEREVIQSLANRGRVGSE
jgi:hypothetical protein